MSEYYRERAAEYDAIYAKPERQTDLARLHSLLPELVRDRTVLEIAAGTGYWTTTLSTTAESVLATDLNDEPLEIARSRSYGGAVAFQRADAYDLEAVAGDFDTAFAGFFWSHIPRSAVATFLRGMQKRLGSGGRLILMDNRYVEGSSSPVTRTTADGDTFQTRTLTDGRTFEVLKNFPTREQFIDDVAPFAEVEWTELPYFWLATLTFR
jgi:protein-L-isoaspartate O-methyltransferase